ncbi:MAG: GFA family protein [Hyphomicrobium sp.]
MQMSTNHTGGCHCGGVRFEATVDLSNTITCNCSICRRAGTILTFTPQSSFRLLQGEDLLTDYQFASRTIHHVFCRVCGIRSFARGVMPDGTPIAAINVRCLDGVDLDALSPAAVDGKSF